MAFTVASLREAIMQILSAKIIIRVDGIMNFDSERREEWR